MHDDDEIGGPNQGGHAFWKRLLAQKIRFNFLAAYHLFFIKLNGKIFVSILKLKLNGGSHDSKSTFGAKFGPQS